MNHQFPSKLTRSSRALLATFRTAGGRPCLELALLADLLDAMVRTHPATLAACLLPDHLHWLLLAAHRDAVPRFDWWSREVATRLGLRGQLWQGRTPEITEIEDPETAALHLLENPVRLQLVREASAWPWSVPWVEGAATNTRTPSLHFSGYQPARSGRATRMGRPALHASATRDGDEGP